MLFRSNDESKVNPILLDRMYKIKTHGYGSKEKEIISEQFLLPRIVDKIGIKATDIKFSEEAIKFLIDRTNEKGVRCLKRSLETIVSKLNLIRLMGTPWAEMKVAADKVKFPMEITKDIAEKLTERKVPERWRDLYI